MFAVIKTGGKQYRVVADDVLQIEKLAGEAGDVIPSDGEIIEGLATIDESAITGESAGGGGAEFTVEIVVRALVPSPFAKDRSIEAIIGCHQRIRPRSHKRCCAGSGGQQR